MSPLVAKCRAVVARLVELLTRTEERAAGTIANPTKRWVAAIVIPGFMLFQSGSVAFQSILPDQLKSGFGLQIPWQMFANVNPLSARLEVIGTTANGETFHVPVHDEIFTHYRGMMRISAFEEASWLISPAGRGNMARKRLLAEYFRDRLERWDIHVVQIQLLLVGTMERTGDPVPPRDLGTFQMDPVPRRAPQ